MDVAVDDGLTVRVGSRDGTQPVPLQHFSRLVILYSDLPVVQLLTSLFGF